MSIPPPTTATGYGVEDATPEAPNKLLAPELSSAREKVLEHLFVGDLLRHLWRRGIHDMEVLRAEVDLGGYDIVLEANGKLRYVQLKSSHASAKARHVKVNLNLSRKPGGCVIWVRFDPKSVELGPFFWFGGPPNEAMPSLGDRVARHTKGNRHGIKAERPNIRILPIAKFKELATIADVAEKLFDLRSAEQIASGEAVKISSCPTHA